MDKIIKAIRLDDYKIKTLTSSGISGVFDVKPYLKGSAFSELKNASYFNLVRPTHHGISWPHEQYICPDTLYLDSVKPSHQAGRLKYTT